jgi:hypothetical protein
VAGLGGERIAQIAFTRRIAHAACLDDGRIVVAAGHLILLEIASAPAAVTRPAAEPQPRASPPSGARPLEPSGERPTSERGIPVRWIEAQKTSRKGKARYRGPMGRRVTIERLALAYYAELGYHGAWTENDYWAAILVLLFWDVYFAPIPGAFSGPLQDMPRDLGYPAFYTRRERMIRRRTRQLTRPRWFGLHKPDIEAALRASYRQHCGQPCRMLDWSRYSDVSCLAMGVQALAPAQLMTILHRIMRNVGVNRSGLPDLFLSGAEGPLFVEVKSERERAGDHQFAWLHFLRDEVGVAVELCRVVNRG